MKAVILAAGLGTRLRPYTNLVPKPLMPIEMHEGKFLTIIERIIRQISQVGIEDVVIVVNYKAQMIKAYLGDESFGCRLQYVEQEILDGNAGAFYRAQHLIDGAVLITDCDNYFSNEETLRDMVQQFYESNPDILVGASRVDNPSKYAIIKTEEEKPVDIYEKPESGWGNLAKSGVMILSNRIASMDRRIAKTDEKYTTTQIIKHCMENDYTVKLFDLAFTDIGTWDEYILTLRGSL